jgi:hypothetical protein
MGNGASIEAVANQVCEWFYRTSRDYGDEVMSVELSATVIGPAATEGSNGADSTGETTMVVPGFFAEDGVWRIRFAPPRPGVYRFTTTCSDHSNGDLHGKAGRIDVRPYTGSHPLYSHGPVRVSPRGPWFEHADGKPFFWLGDTWWMYLSKRLTWPEDVRSLTLNRKHLGFTVIQLVAGFFSDMLAFDERGANEAGFPWEEGYSKINPGYFDNADVRIAWLVQQGLVPCILGGWGYHALRMGLEKTKQHWRYLVARYGAYPVVWSLAGETAMVFGGSATKEEDRTSQIELWTSVARYVKSIDPYRRPIATHPSGNSCGHDEVTDTAALDFEMVQGGQNGYPDLVPTSDLVREAVDKVHPKPALLAEACYEGIRGGSKEEVQRFLFWSTVLSGAAGFTYGANGIWQVNQPGRPFGPKPSGMSAGDIPWTEACNLPGAKQISLGKRFLERFEWWKLSPCSDCVAVGSEAGARKQVATIPFCAAIGDSHRFLYLSRPLGPQSFPIVMKNLSAGSSYTAFYFDPVSGDEYRIGSVRADDKGRWSLPLPPIMQDWVLALEKA